MKATHTFALPLLGAFLLVESANGQNTLVNVDWGKGPGGSGSGDSAIYIGAAAIGAPGDFWNTTDPESNVLSELENIADATGTSTSVNVVWSDELQSSVNAGAIEFGSTGHNALMEDYGFTFPGTTASVTISGLPANANYSLYLYGVPDGASQDTTFSVTNANEQPQTVLAGNTADDNGLDNPEDYVVFTGTTGPGGQIVFTQTGSSFSGSNGFQLEFSNDGSAPPSPGAPTLENPVDAANDIPVESASLSWSSASDAADYLVFLWKSSDQAPDPALDPPLATVTALSLDLDPLEFATEYSWLVQARNVTGTTSSDVFTFTTTDAPPPLEGTLINVDWGKGAGGFGAVGNGGTSEVQTGAAVIGNPGNTWNSADPESNNFVELTDIIDAENNPTEIDVTWTDELQSSLNPNNIEFGSSGVNALMEDYAFTAPGTTATITISGLEPEIEYNLYLYGVPDGANQDTTFEVLDSTEGTLTVLAGATNDDDGLADPEDYVVFTGLTSSNGEITYTQTGSSFSGSNGFQLLLVGDRAPLVLEIDQDGSNLEFSWNSRPGVSYDLVSSTGLDTAPSTWQPVAGQEDIPADESGTNTVTISQPSEQKRFYAIVESP